MVSIQKHSTAFRRSEFDAGERSAAFATPAGAEQGRHAIGLASQEENHLAITLLNEEFERRMKP